MTGFVEPFYCVLPTLGAPFQFFPCGIYFFCIKKYVLHIQQHGCSLLGQADEFHTTISSTTWPVWDMFLKLVFIPVFVLYGGFFVAVLRSLQYILIWCCLSRQTFYARGIRGGGGALYGLVDTFQQLGEYFGAKFQITFTCYRQGPSQDAPFDLILWYIAKTIPTFKEQDQFVIWSSHVFFNLLLLFVRLIKDRSQYYKISFRYTSIFKCCYNYI